MPKPPTLWKTSEAPTDEFERLVRRRGAAMPAGVDEVGRGCLAGPVVAAAVVLPARVALDGLNDSKKLTPEKRRELYPKILQQAHACAVAWVEVREIEAINILQASLKAMRLALEQLSVPVDYVLIDGRDRIPEVNVQQMPIIGGDGRSVSIAAASIIAKVTRDRLMRLYSRRYPGYFFEDNKGYGTQAHRDALQTLGPCPIHRRTFAGVEDYALERL